ncbi:MAG: YfcC family protein [Fusobacterium sp.]|nr:YfcC family protein [Fusobacterium sp.]
MFKKSRKSLSGIVVLFLLLVLVAVSTYFIPGGEYARIKAANGRTIVDATSFKFVESNPIGIFDFFKTIPKGLKQAAMLIIMISLIGSSIKIVESTNSIRAFIYYLKNKIGEKNSYLILILISIFFGMLGTFPGMLEAVIPFIPLCIGIALSLGYDMLVGISMSLVPIAIGWGCGVTNPWTTGIGQSLAELPMFSGLGYRFVIFVILMLLTLVYTVSYANKIKNDPTKSIIYGKDLSHLEYDSEEIKITGRHTAVLVIFIATIFAVVFGALKLKWNMIDMSAAYIIGGILCGIAFGYSANEISEKFIEGGKGMFIATFAIGMARGVSVLMTEAHIIDTVVYSTASILKGNSAYINSICMFIMQTITNFFVPSGSGQAVVTLPILLPVADLIGLNRQIAILAFQFGDGFSNLMYPTVGALIAVLAYSKITFGEWMRYIYKFMVLVMLISIIALVVAVKINFS